MMTVIDTLRNCFAKASKNVKALRPIGVLGRGYKRN